MKLTTHIYIILLSSLLVCSCMNEAQKIDTPEFEQLMIRLSEIEIEPAFLDEYLEILAEESKSSVELEPGVISIYPMFQKEQPNEIRILEIYANREAYEAHLKTPHFQHYKTSTLKMVKSLKLIDMSAIDGPTMPLIFKKLP